MSEKMEDDTSGFYFGLKYSKGERRNEGGELKHPYAPFKFRTCTFCHLPQVEANVFAKLFPNVRGKIVLAL